jgi:hypothetical protein
LRPLGVGHYPTTAGEDVGLLDSFAFYFVIGAVTPPTAIASYSLVGEKVERSLEPLLSTPVSDAEILAWQDPRCPAAPDRRPRSLRFTRPSRSSWA